MPHSDELNANGFAEPKLEKVNPKLVLCFDGTGNQYSANTSDTNIVKLYQKFDREVPNQYHYYQRKSTTVARRRRKTNGRTSVDRRCNIR